MPKKPARKPTRKPARERPAPPATGPKRTDDVRRKHLAEMARALADGRSPTEVVEQAAASYGVSVRQAWDDYAEVRKQWAGEAEKERADVAGAFGLALLRRGQIYRAALANGDPGLALEVEQDRCKLLGLYPAERAEVKTTGRLEVVEEIVSVAADPGAAPAACAKDGPPAPRPG